MIHVTPRNSPLANKDGWVEVDKLKLQHVRYPNVFALGDASDLPPRRPAQRYANRRPSWLRTLWPR
jgi:sulfide:quinone oxidoreductase